MAGNSELGPTMMEAFTDFLCTQEIIDRTAAKRAREDMANMDMRLGKVALLEGFVTPEEINKILWIQRDAFGKKFGEVAVDMGVMTQEEVNRAIELQNDQMFAFCQALILQGQIAPGTLFAVLRGFLEKNFDLRVEKLRVDRHSHISRSIRETLQRITVVAPMPGAVAKLMQMLNNPDVDLDDIAKVISMDVGLTAMLIRLSNSAFYGLKAAVTTVHKAVTVLGLKKLKQMVLSAAVMDNFKSLPAARTQEFWMQSMRAAQWSKELSTFAGKMESDEFFIAGFLHNIGELVIHQYFGAQQREIEHLVSSGAGRVKAELTALGCDHADIGSYLLSMWQLPSPAVQAAMLHNHSHIQIQQMSGITAEAKVVNMAVSIVACSDDANRFGEGMNISQVVEDYRGIVSIDYKKVSDIHVRVDMAVQELMRFFK